MCSSLREFLGRFSRSLTRWPLSVQEAAPELHHSTGRDRALTHKCLMVCWAGRWALMVLASGCRWVDSLSACRCWPANELLPGGVHRGVTQQRLGHSHRDCSAAVPLVGARWLESVMQVIGVDPHKGSHTAVAIGPGRAGHCVGSKVASSRRQVHRLLAWAAPWPERVWAVEGAAGVGRLLAQQLVAGGETVLDVPPSLSTRVRVLSGQSGSQDRRPRCGRGRDRGDPSPEPASRCRLEDVSRGLRLLGVRRPADRLTHPDGHPAAWASG